MKMRKEIQLKGLKHDLSNLNENEVIELFDKK